MNTVTPFLWFDSQAEEAMNFYVSVFPNSRVLNVWRAGGKVMGVTFRLNGQEIRGLNGGPEFKFTEAVSFFVDCETQEEVDRYWKALTASGGSEGQCGWLKDKYGLSWQIVPKQLGQLMGSGDQKKSQRVMDVMLKMKKLDIAGLQKAYDRSS